MRRRAGHLKSEVSLMPYEPGTFFRVKGSCWYSFTGMVGDNQDGCRVWMLSHTVVWTVRRTWCFLRIVFDYTSRLELFWLQQCGEGVGKGEGWKQQPRWEMIIIFQSSKTVDPGNDLVVGWEKERQKCHGVTLAGILAQVALGSVKPAGNILFKATAVGKWEKNLLRAQRHWNKG